LTSDLLLHARQHGGVIDYPIELESIERAYGRQILDERVRPAAATARERARGLAEAAGGVPAAVGLTFAADLFVSLTVERVWRARDIRALLPALSGVLEMDEEALRVQLLVGALRVPQLLELPPLVAIDVQLNTLMALTPTVEASIWARDDSGRPECLIAVGGTASTRRFTAVASRTLEGGDGQGERELIVGVPVRRWQAPWAALVVRVRTRDVGDALLQETAGAIGPIVERDFLLQRSASRERTLVRASERRLSRLGFDLHDGALQHLAALGTDLRHLRPRLPQDFSGDVDSLESQLSELDRVLRELAHSLEPASLLGRPLERVVEAEVAGLTERTGIDVRARVTGDFGAMTQSQTIALIRVLQEAFTNIREHSSATSVDVVVTANRSCVELQVTDDGVGFDVTSTLQRAAQRGRLGLVGSSERVRLLGGAFDIRSRVGGPTTVALTLPRWQPLATAEESNLQLAY
jgi:signal transduction histidine kinase